MPSAAAFALLLALPLCGFASPTVRRAPEDSATIHGTVVDDTGQPAKDASVFVYSARLKQGYAIVCPTCFIDCGKHADTDAQGQFTITGLNPTLKFRLLVVKEGFTATAKGGVDPVQGPLQPIKLTQREPTTDQSKIVRARVIDDVGNPIAGAVVEPVGAIESANLSSFGTINWMDELAVTNAAGEFVINSTRPVEKIMLKISPRGLAQKIVTVPSGSAINSVVMTEGVTIMGRLVAPNGTAIPQAEVVMIPLDHFNEESFSDMRVGTDRDGSFVFTNVPARRIWGIYPSIESLGDRNLAAAPRWCESPADRQVVKVGKITLRPGFSVSGKVVLVDAKWVPPGMHVTINPEWTVTNRLTPIASDGTFAFNTLAPGIYSLTVGINGYKPTDDSPHRLLVDNDRSNILIRMARSP
jgi:carboxypeptidase family protein